MKASIISKAIFVAIIIAFILSLLPLLITTCYAHAYADDFSYGAKAHIQWKETGSVIKAINEAVVNTEEVYKNWQGTYIAVFIMSLSPIAFSPELYKFAAVLLLLIFIACHIFISWALICRLLGGKFRHALYIAMAMIFVSVQCLSSFVEGFTWFNGAWYYTFFYCLSLCLAGFMALLFKYKGAKKVLSFIIMIVLAILIGGGNYVTALMTAFAAASLSIWLAIKRNRNSVWFGIISIILIAGLVISCIAPGNAVRAQDYQQSGIISALISSIFHSFDFLLRWPIERLTFGISILLIPVIYQFVKESNVRFINPLLMIIITFSIFASQFFPPIYATGSIEGAERILNHILFTLQILWYVNLINFIGWWHMKGKKFSMLNDSKDIYIILSVLILLISFAKFPIRNLRAYQSFRDISTGQVAQYESEMMYRHELLENSPDDNIELDPKSANPQNLSYVDIMDDPACWINVGVAEFYQKESVKLK